MTAIVFIGDEVTATGFALAGMQVHTPDADTVGDTLERAQQEADLVLITAERAQHVAGDRLNRALVAVDPPTVIVPDLREQASPPDLGARWRGQLETGL